MKRITYYLWLLIYSIVIKIDGLPFGFIVHLAENGDRMVYGYK